MKRGATGCQAGYPSPFNEGDAKTEGVIRDKIARLGTPRHAQIAILVTIRLEVEVMLDQLDREDIAREAEPWT